MPFRVCNFTFDDPITIVLYFNSNFSLCTSKKEYGSKAANSKQPIIRLRFFFINAVLCFVIYCYLTKLVFNLFFYNYYFLRRRHQVMMYPTNSPTGITPINRMRTKIKAPWPEIDILSSYGWGRSSLMGN